MASRLPAGKSRQRAEIVEALDGLQRLGAATTEEVREAARLLTTSSRGKQDAEPAPQTSALERDRLSIK
jgi:hypothetical protein